MSVGAHAYVVAGEQSHLEIVRGAQGGELSAALLPALAAAHTVPTPGPPAGLAPGSPAWSPASHAPEQGVQRRTQVQPATTTP